ncbi:NAD(P)/FAD-dependent oxidoreductase [Fundidesulfovibrio butyratiphilus]
MSKHDVVVLGAGASGLFCALHASWRGLDVAVVDHGPATARKLRITGGGRCNFGNVKVEPEHYLGENPNFVRSALARFGQAGFLDFLSTYGLTHYEEPNGKLFCTQGACAVADLLESQCRSSGVVFHLGRALDSVERGQEYRLVLSDGLRLSASRLVIACGGPAWPQIGATDLMARLAGQFGLRMVAFRPVLVPLTMGKQWPFAALTGISLPVTFRSGGKSFAEDLLFTHQGLSGPAALQASCRWKPGQSLDFDLLPGRDLPAALRERASGRTLVKTALARLLPARLAELVLPADLADRPVAQLRKEESARLSHLVANWRVLPSGTAGLKKAEAVAGGADTSRISSKTMEVKDSPGLFILGEALDVAGQLGGYNLHWAFASAQAAAEAL